MSPMAAENLRIVLVGTQHPGNIGAAARAMKTMGLSKLVLVAPEKTPDGNTHAMAAGADDLIEAAPVFATLHEAVADCRWVLGCTARSRCGAAGDPGDG
jgi:tRNA (cytidine32/uridine32-2'-O)-methyltransferase